MNKKITFQGMPHSAPLNAHANAKLDRILEVLDKNNEKTPFFVELWLKPHKIHPHHEVELHLKTPRFDLHAHDEGTDLYAMVDRAVDKVIEQLIKAKDKEVDKEHKVENAKNKFADDRYTLSEEEEIPDYDEEEDDIEFE